jgi:hypothetical protein
MINHIITIGRVTSYAGRAPGHDYQAECACGWVSNRSWLQATTRRLADHHIAAVGQPTA